MPAASRTVRVTAPSITLPAHASPVSGPWLTRPRVGLRPTSPHSLAGIRIDPPPSPACATATMPLATPAAEPPDEPPVEYPVCHGLRAGGKLSASVVTVVPSSGTLVRPRGMKPAARNCPARYEVTGHATSFSGPSPKAITSPATRQPRSLSRIGTPRNGPSGSVPAACARACSNRVRITASSRGLTASIRAIAASTRSFGLTSPRRTRSAWAVASSQVISVTHGTLPSQPQRWPPRGSVTVTAREEDQMNPPQRGPGEKGTLARPDGTPGGALGARLVGTEAFHGR